MKYTPEQTRILVEQYSQGATVEQLAQQVGVPNRSIIAKLSSLGVYKKKSYLNKRGEVPVKKEHHIAKIAELIGVDECVLDSLEKATKGVLVLIIKALEGQKSA